MVLWCYGAEGVDSFAFSWVGENCWIVPPPKLVPKVIKHMKQCHAKGVMVVLKWQSAIFWPILHDGVTWRAGITLLLEFVKPTNFFIKAPGGNDVFNENKFLSNVLVLMVDFA